MLSLIEIQHKIEKLGEKINVLDNMMPTYGVSKKDGSMHIEIISQEYHLIVLERDNKLEDYVTRDLDHLLYRVFEKITSSMASSHVASMRKKGDSFRQEMFTQQLHLLRSLNPEWEVLRIKEISEILTRSPYA